MENLKFLKKEELMKKYNDNVENRKVVIQKLLELTKNQQALEKERDIVEKKLTALNKERNNIYDAMVENDFVIK